MQDDKASQRQYLKFSPKEDEIILSTLAKYGRGDYQRVVQALNARAAELPYTIAAFYSNAQVPEAQKKNRIYRRQKALLTSR